MFSCPVCSQLTIKASALIKHVKYIHNYGHVNFSEVTCPSQDCGTKLGTWSGFLRHIKSHNCCPVNLIDTLDCRNFEPLLSDQSAEDEFVEINHSEEFTVDLGIKIINNILGNFSGTLLASGINNSTLDLIMREVEYSFSEVFCLIIKLAKPLLNDNTEIFSMQIKGLLQGFKKMRSSYMRQQYFEANDKLILPVEKSLGSRTELRVKNFKREQVIVSDTFMYVPILKSLEKIVASKEFAKYFFTGINPSSSPLYVYQHYKDSNSFKQNKLFLKYPNAIQIQLFYDDFETVNPLGSKRGVHKIGGLYFTLRNFPDYLNSQLAQINLLALFYTEDAKNMELVLF